MGKLDMFWFPTGTGGRCYLQFNIAGLRERTTGMNELFDRTSFAVARIRAGDARRREYFTAPARLRPRRQDPNALAIYLQWPGKKKMFGGRKPLTLRHCGYVPTALAEAFHACGLVRGTDPIFLVLDNLWYRDDDSSTYGAAVNLIVSADEWRSLHAAVTEAAAWGSVLGVGRVDPEGEATFQPTHGTQPRTLYPQGGE